MSTDRQAFVFSTTQYAITQNGKIFPNKALFQKCDDRRRGYICTFPDIFSLDQSDFVDGV